MHRNDASAYGEVGDQSVVAAVDDIDSRNHLVIADVSQDDAWIAIPEGQAEMLPTSR